MLVKQFFYGETLNDVGKIAHVLKHSHGRCVIGSFDKILHEGSLWTGHRAVILFILHKSIFLHFVQCGTKFYEKYMSSQNQLKHFDDNGSGLLPKIVAKKWNNLKDHRSYSYCEYVLAIFLMIYICHKILYHYEQNEEILINGG